VICISHLPAIAACAERHFSVRKDVRRDRTTSAVEALDSQGRVSEIARMFGGTPAGAESPVSIRHAKELLEASRG
jgi:DNA repair protein RecN (Recombination protein N)